MANGDQKSDEVVLHEYTLCVEVQYAPGGKLENITAERSFNAPAPADTDIGAIVEESMLAIKHEFAEKSTSDDATVSNPRVWMKIDIGKIEPK